MKLPRFENVFIDDDKIYGYILNSLHPVGKHKAFLFQTLLEINQTNGYLLKDALKSAVVKNDAILQKQTNHGKYYIVDFGMTHKKVEVIVRSSWIIRTNEDFQRLISCFIK